MMIMANATPVTAAQTEADEATTTAATPAADATGTTPAITEVKGKAAVAPKAAKAKEVSEDFTNGIKRETY
jgi:hypothetical protein